MNKLFTKVVLLAALVGTLLAVPASATIVAGINQPTSISWNDPSKITIAQPAAGVSGLYLLRGDGSWVADTDLATLLASNGIISRKVTNSTATAQTPAATTRTYVSGSALTIPATGLQAGTVLRWRFNMTKTAAGSATSTFDIAFGTTGTTTDTAQVSFTKPAGTAAVDEGWVEIECVVKTINASTGVVQGEFTLIHNLASTGHAVIPCVAVATTSGSFNTVSPTFVGICITTGASDAITISQVSCSAFNI